MYQVKIIRKIDVVKESATLDDNGNELTPEILKTEEEMATEKQAIIDTKTAEIQAEIDAYEAAKKAQFQNGGPGPVADFEIMKIVNEYSGQFEVIIED